jgi:hypothetical protein
VAAARCRGIVATLIDIVRYRALAVEMLPDVAIATVIVGNAGTGLRATSGPVLCLPHGAQ